MIYNQRLSKLPILDVAPVWAKLTRIDTSGVYEWLLNPNVLSYTISNNISALTPLGATLPNIAPQNSGYTLSLPLLLVTPSNNLDLSDDIAILTAFSTLKNGVLPKLSFEFGSFKIPLCCIQSLNISIIQWRSGKPTQATGSLTLLVYAEPKPPTIFKEDVVKKPTVALTEREQVRVAEVMRKLGDKYNDVRVNGDYIEGISRKTGKRERITSLRDVVKIDLITPISRDSIPNIPPPSQIPTP